jgi:hypothetical protein
MTCPTSTEQGKLKQLRRADKVMNQLKILLGLIQVMTNIEVCLNFEWPGFFKQFLNAMSFVNLDLSWMLSTTIDPCAFGLSFFHGLLIQAALLPIFMGTVYLAFYTRTLTMACMQKLSKTCSCCCKIKVAGAATVQLRQARKALADQLKKRALFEKVHGNVNQKLSKSIESAKTVLQNHRERTQSEAVLRKEEVNKLRKEAGMPPVQNNANNPVNAFVPPPPPPLPLPESLNLDDGAKKEENLELAKLQVVKLESAEEKLQKDACDLEQKLKVALLELKDKLQKSKEQYSGSIGPIEQGVEDAQWELEDAEKHIEELAIEKRASRDRLVFWINCVIFFVFPGLVVKIFKLFDCTRILDKIYLTVDLRQECWVGTHLWYFAVGLCFVLIYVIGVPAYTLFMLYSRRASLYNTEHPEFFSTRRQWGGVFAQYEEEYFYWEVIEMVKKVILTGGLIIVAKGTSAQILVAEVICASYLLLVVRTLPYHSDADDLLQSVASISLLFTLMIVFAIKTDVPNNREYNLESMGLLLTFLNTIVFLLAIFGICVVVCPGFSKLIHKLGGCHNNNRRHPSLEEEEEENEKAAGGGEEEAAKKTNSSIDSKDSDTTIVQIKASPKQNRRRGRNNSRGGKSSRGGRHVGRPIRSRTGGKSTKNRGVMKKGGSKSRSQRGGKGKSTTKVKPRSKSKTKSIRGRGGKGNKRR